jgi:hypothetical protein
METLGDKKVAKVAHTQYYCEQCDYVCCKKSNYDKHILTAKHKKVTLGDKKVAKSSKKEPNDNIITNDIVSNKYLCEYCDREYCSRNGLWKHKKNCKSIPLKSADISDKELMMMLIKDNSEFKSMLMKVVENGTHNTTNTHINSHNKAFNLNFFLNETCKDAMNIMDFVDSIKLQLSDLENVGKIGFIEGISDIIVKNLNSLDETKRPVHCTDSKREVMYVKDENKWEKENETKLKLRKAIKKVAHKNTQMLSQFRTKHPDCLKSESKLSDKYNKLVFEAMGGKGDNDSEKEDKIIKKIAKEVVIEK